MPRRWLLRNKKERKEGRKEEGRDVHRVFVGTNKARARKNLTTQILELVELLQHGEEVGEEAMGLERGHAFDDLHSNSDKINVHCKRVFGQTRRRIPGCDSAALRSKYTR